MRLNKSSTQIYTQIQRPAYLSKSVTEILHKSSKFLKCAWNSGFNCQMLQLWSAPYAYGVRWHSSGWRCQNKLSYSVEMLPYHSRKAAHSGVIEKTVSERFQQLLNIIILNSMGMYFSIITTISVKETWFHFSSELGSSWGRTKLVKLSKHQWHQCGAKLIGLWDHVDAMLILSYCTIFHSPKRWRHGTMLKPFWYQIDPKPDAVETNNPNIWCI